MFETVRARFRNFFAKIAQAFSNLSKVRVVVYKTPNEDTKYDDKINLEYQKTTGEKYQKTYSDDFVQRGLEKKVVEKPDKNKRYIDSDMLHFIPKKAKRESFMEQMKGNPEIVKGLLPKAKKDDGKRRVRKAGKEKKRKAKIKARKRKN